MHKDNINIKINSDTILDLFTYLPAIYV